jgi:uncharacterized protein (DUF1015 family)
MEIKPFKAYRYNAKVVGNVGACISPPYDVISDRQQQELYKKSKYNIVRIIRGKNEPGDSDGQNQYTRAANYLSDWIAEGALKQDEQPAIYGYVQNFDMWGKHFERLTFVASTRLEEFGPPGAVRPHEQILRKPMLDRLSLTRATRARFGLVFMLYQDEDRVADKIIAEAAKGPTLMDCVDEQGVRHRLFAITDDQKVDAITKMMGDKTCIIADGHHRYTTGLTYSKECDDPAAKYQMIAFTNICQDGLVVLATHRLVANVEDFGMGDFLGRLKDKFTVTRYGFDTEPRSKESAKKKMLARMKAEHNKDRNAFGIYGGDGAFYVAVLKDKHAMDPVVPDKSQAWRQLDVSVLHKLILEEILGIGENNLAEEKNLEYVKDVPAAVDESIAQVDAGKKQAAFFMNPVKLDQLKGVTDAGERMPQKSTYFYPKMYSGLTIDKL